MDQREIENIDLERVDDQPEHIGWTILGQLSSNEVNSSLSLIRELWRIVAAWGTWRVGHGELPDEVDDILALLPGWYVDSLTPVERQVFEGWLDDLLERDWIWWSSAAVDSMIKIDLDSTGMPISDYMIRQIMEKAGATIIYADLWIPADKSILVPTLPKNEHGRVRIDQLYTLDEAMQDRERKKR